MYEYVQDLSIVEHGYNDLASNGNPLMKFVWTPIFRSSPDDFIK